MTEEPDAQALTMASSWLVPRRAELTSDRTAIRFTFDRKQPKPSKSQQRTTATARRISADETMWILDFAELARAEADDIVQFAKVYGPLRICPHGLPVSHIPERLLPYLQPDVQDRHAHLYMDSPPVLVERLDDWRRYSGQAKAMLLIAKLIHDRSPALDWTLDDEADDDHDPASVETLRTSWDSIVELMPDVAHITWSDDPTSPTPIPPPIPSSHQRWKHVLSLATNRWLELGDVRSHLTWSAVKPSVGFGATSLFGTLALQLALGIANADHYAICSACRQPFATDRKTPTGRDPYCAAKECKRECQRRYQRRRRARKRADSS